MMSKTIKLISVACLMAISQAALAEDGRLHSIEQVKQGNLLFQKNCASCHGTDAASVKNWKQKGADGKYPPPPLNGSGHTWRHPLDQLKSTVQQGGIRLGGSMPPFDAQLTDTEINLVIVYLQTKWSDDIYQKWIDRFKITATASNQSEITRLLRSRLRIKDLAEPVETEVEGVFQTQFGDKFAYLIENGRYVFIGEMVDLQNARNLTEISRRIKVGQELDAVPENKLVIYPALGGEKTVLTVFTDTSCPYCRKLHKEVKFLQKAGITVRYLPYPRGGSGGPGYQTLKQVWCADDRAKAMSIAKGTATGNLPDADCAAASIVDEGFEMGKRLGITGTPSLFTEDGMKITGYRPYQDLIPTLLNNL